MDAKRDEVLSQVQEENAAYFETGRGVCDLFGLWIPGDKREEQDEEDERLEAIRCGSARYRPRL
jgi:hypothetical protein